MNHFLALKPTAEVRDRLAALSERLQAWNLPAHWVHPEDFHLTILFLGHLDEDEARMVPTLVETSACYQRRPELRLMGLGAQGGRHEPQRIFVAIEDLEQRCQAMHQDLSDAVDQVPSPHFRPHITLCRPRPLSRRDGRSAPNASWPRLLEAHSLGDWGPCSTEALALYRRRDDARQICHYEELASWPLLAV